MAEIFIDNPEEHSRHSSIQRGYWGIFIRL